jgi:hypothetical protein
VTSSPLAPGATDLVHIGEGPGATIPGAFAAVRPVQPVRLRTAGAAMPPESEANVSSSIRRSVSSEIIVFGPVDHTDVGQAVAGFVRYLSHAAAMRTGDSTILRSGEQWRYASGDFLLAP